jgi:nitrogen permease regulator 2-like protein
MMMQQQLPLILGIFYAEFHAIYGPKIVVASFQMSTKLNMNSFTPLFDQCSEYILPKSQLCGRTVQISSGAYHILGCPISIQDRKYERNAFLFNLCLVFDDQAELDVFRRIVPKIAFVLRISEVNGCHE